MPELIPFRALRYSGRDPAPELAPPYDVIDGAQAAELRDRSPYNCVRLILPEGNTPERYARAARTLSTWREEKVLAQDPEPAVYLYRQSFRSDGADTKRMALFCALRLSDFAQGQVLPHERTHAGPKADRLALTLAARAQLSPVFLVASDPQGELLDGMLRSAGRPPAFDVTTDDGTGHALWPVSAAAGAEALCAVAGERPLLIADGHHRYETALAVAARLAGEPDAGFLLVCIVSDRDPGLVVRPTHRALSAPAGDSGSPFDWRAALDESFELRGMGPATPAALAEEVLLETAGIGIAPGAGTESWIAVPRRPALEAVGVSREEARIPAVVFDRLILQRLHGLDADAASRAGVLSYHREADAAVARGSGDGCAFILPPVEMGDVWRIAAAGGRLPPKSTYFEPKIPSGLVFRAIGGDPPPSGGA